MNADRDWPRPGDILIYYQRIRETVRVARPVTDVEAGAFFGLSAKALRLALNAMQLEMDAQCTLSLTASIEATFQVDLQCRSSQKKNDRFSSALRQLQKAMNRSRRRIEIEAILDVWKMHLGLIKAIGELRQVIEYRHWLAHGRYWSQKSGLKKVDPFDVWNRWEAVREGICKSVPFPLP